MNKIFITVATTGGLIRKSANPNLPEQPDEIAQAAYECYNEGAAIVHIHARDSQGNLSSDPKIYRSIHEKIRARCDMIIQDTIGINFQGGLDPTPQSLLMMLDALPKLDDVIVNVTCIGRFQPIITSLGMLLGTHIRVGMEDNIYYSKGVLAISNAQLVARGVRIARELGFEIASPQEAREILKVPYKVYPPSPA